MAPHAWDTRGMTQNGGTVQHKRGHNTMMTGLALLVFGVAFALIGGTGDAAGIQGVGILAAFAGFITLLVGIGRRREKPVD